MSTQTIQKKTWYVNLLTSTLGRKFIMAGTGLFLVLFLAVHLIGNLQLLIPDEGKTFNEYAHFMGHNKFIQAISVGNFFFILLHIAYSFALTRYNISARPQQYAYAKTNNSSWTSRNMMILGTLVLIFIVVHLQAFWAKSKFGGLEPISYNGVEHHNLYLATKIAFAEWWIVLLYVVSMIALAFHLSHGVASAFQTLGLNHVKYTPLIKVFGYAFAIIVPFLFALIPVWMFIAQNM
ncbi:MAG: succinate dehydrogenase [Cytophagales bacterium]|nr:MAG: succinate dehydrogenase [Cytophagales bacterium]